MDLTSIIPGGTRSEPHSPNLGTVAATVWTVAQCRPLTPWAMQQPGRNLVGSRADTGRAIVTSIVHVTWWTHLR